MPCLAERHRCSDRRGVAATWWRGIHLQAILSRSVATRERLRRECQQVAPSPSISSTMPRRPHRSGGWGRQTRRNPWRRARWHHVGQCGSFGSGRGNSTNRSCHTTGTGGSRVFDRLLDRRNARGHHRVHVRGQFVRAAGPVRPHESKCHRRGRRSSPRVVVTELLPDYRPGDPPVASSTATISSRTTVPSTKVTTRVWPSFGSRRRARGQAGV